ncbi:hypothetical protein ACFEMC_11330 [Kineococcus sp. DHX-1]|uniref:hypothetical protein n=1 Tax=Kineococcus sp. DHX-1 TaxID=3349638 RepID=UPI0036D30AE7
MVQGDDFDGGAQRVPGGEVVPAQAQGDLLAAFDEFPGLVGVGVGAELGDEVGQAEQFGGVGLVGGAAQGSEVGVDVDVGEPVGVQRQDGVRHLLLNRRRHVLILPPRIRSNKVNTLCRSGFRESRQCGGRPRCQGFVNARGPCARQGPHSTDGAR